MAPNAELKTPYFNAGLPVVKEQLKTAGVRLALLINSAAAGDLLANMLKFE